MTLPINRDFTVFEMAITLQRQTSKCKPMKTVLKVFLMAIAYLALFILGAWSGAIHPACYAYIGAVLPLVSAFIYLYTCTLIRGFGAATALNGFIFVGLHHWNGCSDRVGRDSPKDERLRHAEGCPLELRSLRFLVLRLHPSLVDRHRRLACRCRRGNACRL